MSFSIKAVYSNFILPTRLPSNSKFEKGRGDVVRFRGDDKPKSQASKSNGALS